MLKSQSTSLILRGILALAAEAAEEDALDALDLAWLVTGRLSWLCSMR